MPKRGTSVEKKSAPKESLPSIPVDLDFLPDHYIKRIGDIFDMYLGLGMKYSAMQLEDDATPSFPNKVSSLSSPELGDVLGRYTSWYSYTMDKHKYISVALNFLEEELTKESNDYLGDNVASKGNIEAKKADARRQDGYLAILEYAQKLRGLKIMLDGELSNYDRCISTLSREVSRRENSGGF